MMKSVPVLPRKVVVIIGAVVAILLLASLFWPERRPPVPESPDLSFITPSFGPISPIPDFIPGLSPEKVALGKMLFNEVSLSHDNTMACASCHQLTRGGVDSVQYSVGIRGQVSGVNTPTVFNSVFNFRQFWNGRAKTLEEQAAGPIHNPMEMGSDWTEVISKLKRDPDYVRAFSKNYRNGITSENIADAIATFVRSLITPNSRFDKYLRGNTQAITPYELTGYELFSGYGCISCHQGVNIGGNMYERLGIMRNYFEDRGNITKADFGLYEITQNPDDMFAFKVPSLRNIALTAPYFHDGSAQTLEQAVVTMGKYQLGILLPAEDVARIVAFLHTLTGEYDGKPL